jgi:rod shape-determining protein MreD
MRYRSRAWPRDGPPRSPFALRRTVRVALALTVPLAAALLQSTLAPGLSIAGVRPSLPVLVAGSWSLAAGAREAAWWAFAAAVFADLFSRGPLGASALAALPAVVAIGVGERRGLPVAAAASLVGLAAFAFGAAYAALLALLGHPLPPFQVIAFETAGCALYTGVLALLAYPLARTLGVRREQESPF